MIRVVESKFAYTTNNWKIRKYHLQFICIKEDDVCLEFAGMICSFNWEVCFYA